MCLSDKVMCVSLSLCHDKVEALERTLDELNGKLAQEIGAKSALQMRAVDLQEQVVELQHRLLLQVYDGCCVVV